MVRDCWEARASLDLWLLPSWCESTRGGLTSTGERRLGALEDEVFGVPHWEGALRHGAKALPRQSEALWRQRRQWLCGPGM
jgi:hypothetical protein